MENKNKKQVGSSLDHLFGPKESSSSSQGVFGSIFSPQLQGTRRGVLVKTGNQESMTGESNEGESSSGTGKKGKGSVPYQNETCYFSSSIHYGGRENYSPRPNSSQPQNHPFKKGGGDQDSTGNNARNPSMGNWWEGSLYY